MGLNPPKMLSVEQVPATSSGTVYAVLVACLTNAALLVHQAWPHGAQAVTEFAINMALVFAPLIPVVWFNSKSVVPPGAGQ